jgi:diguanylate cyclase (GGDEF)-like protein
MLAISNRQPWLVRNQYRMRFSALTLLFVAAGLDMFAKNRALADWALLGLVMLSYPHVQYWRTSRSSDALKSELKHLVMDAVVVGFLMAATGLSLWISFAAMLGTLMDNVTNKGWKTIGETCLGFLLGGAVWAVLFGFAFSPDSGLPVALFCSAGLTGYLLVMSNSGYLRHGQLRQARQDLRNREADLLTVNLALKNKLQENLDLQQQLLTQATHDPLTGLYNRRFLDGALEAHMALSKREGTPLAFIMIDIDRFKDFNDCYGHLPGDECLKRVAQALHSKVQRASDVAARYGGEEFVLVLPNTPFDTALSLANEIRQSVEALAIPHERSAFGKVTISLGVAVTYKNHYRDAADLLRAADDALYQAKSAGRNQVRTARES